MDSWTSFSENCYLSGCTDPLACNYNSLAWIDDGSCLTIYGCTDSLACNYNSSAGCDDGSCLTVYGCMDSTAFNYNANATCDDGGCIPFIYGCTDSTFTNYNPLANTDNGSCVSYTYIPDDNFEQYLISLGLDNAPLDDTVLTSAIDTVETLQLGFLSIYDLTELKIFLL